MIARLRRSNGQLRADDLHERVTTLERELALIRKRLPKQKGVKKIQDKRFLLIAADVHEHRRTLLQNDRLWILWQAVKNTARLDLPAAEVGSFRGGSAFFIALAYLDALGHEVPVHVIDTFDGHPAEKLTDVDPPTHKPTTFSETSFAEVAAYLSEFERVQVHQGEFSRVAPDLPEQRYGFVHIDVDLYVPALECLHYFGPRLSPGGVIVLDDYEAVKCPGIRLAVDEFLQEELGYQAWNPHTEQLILIKTG